MTLPTGRETSNSLVGLWSGERSTMRITKRDKAQTERALLKDSFDISSVIAVCIKKRQEQKSVARHPCIEPVTSCCLCCVARTTWLILWSPQFAHGSGAFWFFWLFWLLWLFYIDPRQYVMATTEVLLARLIILEIEAVQARQRQGSAKQALALAQQRIQQLSSGSSVPTTAAEVIDTRTLGKAKSFTGQSSEWTTWQFTFKRSRVRCMRR